MAQRGDPEEFEGRSRDGPEDAPLVFDSVIRRLPAHLELREHAGEMPDLREGLAQELLSLASNEFGAAPFDEIEQDEAA